MTASRRQLLLLLALVLIVVALVVWRSPSVTVGGGATAPAAAGAPGSRQVDPVADVKLESLEHRGEGEGTPSRDLFRFESKRVASAPTGSPVPVNPVLVNPPPPGPPGPPPPAPIPLRYIGYLDQPGAVPRVAVLSDGRGNVFNGKEGDIIEGRYRVLRVGTDSADLIYVDGRGRQTIRLSGQ